MKKATTTRKAKPQKAVNRQAVLSDKQLQEKVVEYLQAEEKLLEKHGLAKRLVISFPYSRNPEKIPLTGKIAQKLLTWSRAVLDTQFGVRQK